LSSGNGDMNFPVLLDDAMGICRYWAYAFGILANASTQCSLSFLGRNDGKSGQE
jgi:hypothetical protein